MAVDEWVRDGAARMYSRGFMKPTRDWIKIKTFTSRRLRLIIYVSY